jgi:hypothetical protein
VPSGDGSTLETRLIVIERSGVHPGVACERSGATGEITTARAAAAAIAPGEIARVIAGIGTS